MWHVSAVLLALPSFAVGLGPRVALVAAPEQIQAIPFDLSDVRLLPSNGSSPFDYAAAQDLNLKYLQYLEADRLLFTFRTIAGLDPKGPHGNATPYGGWITPYNPQDELVNGHFTGHYLSALAFASASTDDAEIVAKSKYLVAELGKCQDAICATNASNCGYLSAYHLSQIEHMENHTGPTWATYYTIHKIMSGLIDQYTTARNSQALDIVKKMATYFKHRIDHVVSDRGWAWWQQCLGVEFGGMNEVGYNLYAITGDLEHKALGELFYKEVFMNPLALGHDSLSDQHANTHLPEIVGMARAWEVTSNATYHFLTSYFYQLLSEHYTFSSTGGSNVGEHWRFHDQLGEAIVTTFDASGKVANSNGFHTEETCTQYNVLKVVRHLFKWNPTSQLADDYEHKLLNGVMGVQQPGAVGKMVYMTPLGRGVSRPRANWNEGFGSPDNSFWCCYGTGVESFAKLGDSVYFHNDATLEMWVSQFASSTVRWNAAGLKVSQNAVFSEDGAALEVDLVIQDAKPTAKEAVALEDLAASPTIHVRIPAWSVQESTSIKVNDQDVVRPGDAQIGSFLGIKRNFAVGDTIHARFGMRPRFERINDNRTEYANVGSLHYGPLSLVGLSTGSFALKADPTAIDDWFKLRGPLRFEAVGAANTTFQLMPLNRVVNETYTAYFNISLAATDGSDIYHSEPLVDYAWDGTFV